MTANDRNTHSTYGDDKPRVQEGQRGGRIAAVEPFSPADDAGIEAGMWVLSADGHELHDRIDWIWYTSDEEVELEIAEESGDVTSVLLERDADQDWGITFAEELFDGMHLCRNRCTFCFMSMLPKDLRTSLYLRDDDFRLSFSQGNFVTLTNVTDDEVSRIIEQQLSPLRVSLHAITPAVRQELIGRFEHRGIEVLEQLLEAGLQVDTQIVLVPGVNDGEELDNTLRYLYDKPGVLSCGIVPLGYTRFQTRFTHSFDEPETALPVIEQVQRHNAADPFGGAEPRFFAADAFYLTAQAELPEAACYGGFPLFEDGVGMVRFSELEYGELEEDAVVRAAKEAGPSGPNYQRIVCLTGEAFAPILARLIDATSAFAPVRKLLEVQPVPNAFFGGNVNVTGLLCGCDLLEAIRGSADDTHSTLFLIPASVFNADGLTLDGYTIEALGQESGQAVRVVSCSATGLAETVGRFARF